MLRSMLLSAVLLSAPATAAEPVIAKLASAAPDDTPWSEHVKAFKARVEKGTEGRVKLKLHLGSALGDENMTLSETKRGAIQIWAGTIGSLASLIPELGFIELPYLFRSEEEADHVIDTVVGADVQKLLEARGFVLLFWSENGYRSIGTSFGPVTTPEALQGRKMRSQESEVHLLTWRALKASPVPIPTTEVLSSLQTRVVEGFDQTPLYTFAASLHQGITDYTVTEHIYQPGLCVVNREWLRKLSPADQKVFTQDLLGESQRGRKGVRELAPLLLENFTASKIKVHVLTDAQKDVFAQATAPVHEAWLKGKGRGAGAMVKKAKAALVRFRAAKKAGP
jgi:TRAP-type transport system periplasmic protein